MTQIGFRISNSGHFKLVQFNTIKAMKKLTITTAILLISLFSIAQSFDISPFYGWQMNGRVKFYQGQIKTNDQPLLGGTMDILLAKGYGMRIMYSRTETHSYFNPYVGYENQFPATDFSLINEYYQIGTIKSLIIGKLEPYALTTFGASRFKGTNQNGSENRWHFALTAGLGLKYFFSNKIGIKVEGAFMLPMYFQGVGFYFGGGGSGLSINSRVPLLQGNFNGGLVFRINK